MTVSTHPITFLAHFKALSAFRWALVAGALAASAAPNIAAAQAARPGAFDGTWNVTFAPKAGNCHATNTVPFNVYGTRVSSAGGGKVTGGITRKGNVTVRITVGASWATAAAGSPAIRAPAAGAGTLPATTAAGSGRRAGVSSFFALDAVLRSSRCDGAPG